MAEKPTKLFGRRVHEVRVRKGWTSQERLAARLDELGLGTNRSTIARMEQGNRPVVPLDEALAIAAALEVSPLALMIPAGSERVEIAKGIEATVPEARAWIAGTEPLPGMDAAFFFGNLVDEGWVPVRRHEVRALAGLVDALEAALDREDTKAARHVLNAMAQEVDAQRSAIRRPTKGH